MCGQVRGVLGDGREREGLGGRERGVGENGRSLWTII
jgi:hypothetical protein